jgi:CheY-like chemotaxis protein
MKIRILLVDDDPETLRSYVKLIQRRVEVDELFQDTKGSSGKTSLQLECVDNVPEAIEKLRTQTFELLIVDLKIPGTNGEEMGGLELIKESLKLDGLRPIIAITGYGTIELARKTLTQGVFDFIEKSADSANYLINALKRAINMLNEKIKRSGNPFTPRTGMEPTVFGGRTEELEFIEERLNRALYTRFCEHFLVLGKWGIGKSTLLKEYKKIIQSRGHLVAFLPIEPFLEGTSLDTAIRSFVDGILRSLPYPLERFKKLIGYFDSIGISVLGTGFELSRDNSKKVISPQAFLHDTLLSLWQDLKDKTEVLVILLDDLENLMNISEVVLILKSVLSMDSFSNAKILVGLATTPVYWRTLTSQKRHHPLARYFLSRKELGPLRQEDVTDTIIKSLAGTGVAFGQDIIERIFNYTKGHPFEMQLLCYHLFNNQLSGRVKLENFEKALEVTIKDIGEAIFEKWLEGMSKKETILLRLLGKNETPASEKDLAGAAKSYKLEFAVADISAFLQTLVKESLVSRISDELYEISDPMLRVYVNKFK